MYNRVLHYQKGIDYENDAIISSDLEVMLGIGYNRS